MLKRILVAGVILLGLYTGVDATTWYVSKTGNDTRAGTSWGQAWLSLTNVNDSTRVRSGDTVQFATGIWREQLIIRHGSAGAPTVYADSAFADVNGSGMYHFARLYGSDSLTTWTRIGVSSVYWCLHTRSVTATALYQNDSILWLKPTLGSVTSAGTWYMSADTVYAWVYGGNDPDNYDMEIADIQNLVAGNRGTTTQSYVTFYGLAFKYTYNHMFGGFGGSGITANADYITFNRCYMSHNAGQGGNNPSIFYIGMSETDTDASIGWRFIRDSLGYDWDWHVDNDQSSSSVNACCVDVYIAQRWVIDSCKFFGYQGRCSFYFKSAQNVTSWSEYDTLRFNDFSARVGPDGNGFDIGLYHRVRYIAIYGNIFRNAYANLWLAYGSTPLDALPGYHDIFNNSSYGATRFFEQGQFDGECTQRPYAGQHHIKIRYNVIYGTGSLGMVTDTVAMYDGAASIDSNLYASGTNTFARVGLTCGYVNQTLSTWQNTYGFDQHSRWQTANPFDNINATDPWQGYARSAASNEMNRTYGGKTWTVYGAIQEAATGPRIGVNPSSLAFAADEGAANPAGQSVLISNTGIGTLDWSVSTNAAWLDASPTIGSGNASISVSADITGLAAGSYLTNLTISATGADNSPLQLPVSLTVAGVDNTAPVISGVTGVGLASSTASNVYWTTNEPATSQVEYGLTQAYGTFSTFDATLVTDHAVTLTGLTADTVYHYRVISRDANNNETTSSDNTFRTLQPSSNLALGRPVTVSGSYSGYLPSRVTDGTIAPSGGTSGTWASDQSTSPHWVEIDLQQSVVVRSLRIYWANNTATSQWMRSQSYIIQTWNGTAFVDLATVDNRDTTTYPDTVTTYDSTGAPTGFSVTVAGPSEDVEMSATDFPSVTTSRIRIYQPSNMGPESYATIMWLTEVEVYSEDVAPPQTL